MVDWNVVNEESLIKALLYNSLGKAKGSPQRIWGATSPPGLKEPRKCIPWG